MKTPDIRRFIRPRFGLRVVLASVCLIAVVCTTIGYRVRKMSKVEDLVRRARAADSNVYVEFWPQAYADANVAPSGSWKKWLCERFGWPRVIGFAAGGTTASALPLDQLGQFDELEWLSLCGCQCTDADVEKLGTLHGLTELNLGGANISERGLRIVGTMRELRELDLRGIEITDQGLAQLAGLPKLEYLRLDVGSGVLPALYSFNCGSTLTALDLTFWEPARAVELRGLGRFRKLTSLELHGQLADGHVSTLADVLPALESLQLDGDSLTPRSFVVLARLTKLRDLQVHKLREADAAMTALSHASALAKLRLFETDLSVRGIRELTRLPLTRLEILEAPLGDDAVPVIRSMSTLTNLTLVRTSVSSDAAAALEKSRTWTSFVVHSNTPLRKQRGQM